MREDHGLNTQFPSEESHSSSGGGRQTGVGLGLRDLRASHSHRKAQLGPARETVRSTLTPPLHPPVSTQAFDWPSLALCPKMETLEKQKVCSHHHPSDTEQSIRTGRGPEDKHTAPMSSTEGASVNFNNETS